MLRLDIGASVLAIASSIASFELKSVHITFAQYTDRARDLTRTRTVPSDSPSTSTAAEVAFPPTKITSDDVSRFSSKHNLSSPLIRQKRTFAVTVYITLAIGVS